MRREGVMGGVIQAGSTEFAVDTAIVEAAREGLPGLKRSACVGP
jgi:hypothetical protein